MSHCVQHGSTKPPAGDVGEDEKAVHHGECCSLEHLCVPAAVVALCGANSWSLLWVCVLCCFEQQGADAMRRACTTSAWCTRHCSSRVGGKVSLSLP